MPDPFASARAATQFQPQPSASGDATIARDDQTLSVELPKRAEIGAPAFSPPQHTGEIGKLGRYRVLKELGRGGMGAVFLGYDSRLNRKVALKVMLPRYAEHGDSRERFLREARTAAMVKSDHVVTIFDVGEEQGIPFIAMEYLLGCPLDQYLKTKGELALPHALRIGREAALGLAAAHELGLVHRDIKPGNLWLEAPRGRVKLLDFGLARIEDDDLNLTHTGAMVGTPAFMSPEQARGQKVDYRSDLFSLGVVLYRLTTGRMPFEGNTTTAILTSLAVDTPAPIRQHKPELPEELELLIAGLLAKDAAKRPASAKEVAQRLRSIEQPKSKPGAQQPGEPAEPAPLAISVQTQFAWEGIRTATPKREPKYGRQAPVAVILAGGGLLAVLAVLAFVAIWSRPSVPSTAPRDTSGDSSMASGSSNKSKSAKAVQSPPASDPDRKAAEYVLSIGGAVRVNGEHKDITTVAGLPRDTFSLTTVLLAHNKNVTAGELAVLKDRRNLKHLDLYNTQVTDAGLSHFNGCTTLTYLNLNYNPQISDTGVANFKGCKNLTHLYLWRTRVTDVGLAHFTNCKYVTDLDLRATQVTDLGLAYFKDSKDSLTQLNLQYTKVSDVGLANFKDCRKLRLLIVQQTKISPAAIAEFAKAQPKCRIQHDGGTIEPTVVADPDRRAAEYVLSVGGRVQVNGDNKEITVEADLPQTPFTLTWANFGNPSANALTVTESGLANLKGCRRLNSLLLDNAKGVSDAGLANFEECQDLVYLTLSGTAITDEGLAHFKKCNQLNHLSLWGTKVNDAGVEHLKGCTALKTLNLRSTGVTDVGLAPFKNCKDLIHLDVRSTKVSQEAIAEFARAVPKCRIEHDGGTIEPTVVADPDRMAAEWVLSIGGVVQVSGEQKWIGAATDLPKARFSLTGVDLHSAKTVTDTGLANFKDCKNLTFLQLSGLSQVTDTGLANFKDCKNLTYLDLLDTQATDAGMPYFKDCNNLTTLNLRGTKVGDLGLMNFKDCMNLSYLNLQVTPVTDAGLAHFENCKHLAYLALSEPTVTDAGLQHFQNCKELTTLKLDGTGVTDAGLANFKDCMNLWELGVARTQVTDAGLIHFRDCKSLRALKLHDTQVTDVGLALFKGCAELVHLVVYKTNVTAPMIEEFRNARPQCKIEWDGGVIEASDPDRKAAEYVLSIGGTVRVNGEANDINAAADLPIERFTLTTVGLGGNKNVTDEGIAIFKDCKNLSGLNLNDTKVGDDALAILKDCLNLQTLQCSNSMVSDAGLAQFKDRKNLTHVDLSGTRVTDLGLAHLRACKELSFLGIIKTKISPSFIAEFASELPQCRILHDGGTIEPRK